MLESLLVQASLGIIFYTSVVSIFRIAGKRFAGQTTTFDLVILISLGVAVQQATLRDGPLNAVVFVLVVFGSHLGLARLCLRWPGLRRIVRGKPAILVRDGEAISEAMRAEAISKDELMAGLRKLGIHRIEDVKTAHLEETGQVSAVKFEA